MCFWNEEQSCMLQNKINPKVKERTGNATESNRQYNHRVNAEFSVRWYCTS